ncbi:MAG TPA: sn-glycerol-3-phosphate ABC transporter ATP-binding protein UgpC [Solirubrobacteraceae bacterium]|nr:sn-glycerol-3-phosphate ABC transporter ATP-binding protein UgpC [Solirubrobacteraceae bacterium]
MGGIRLTELTKAFRHGPVAVDGVDLEIEDGEFMVLVGPSGCGKSTLLRLIAGIEEPTAGTIHIGERDVTRLEPRKRDIAMVFQNYALYPHLTVRGNLGFGLRLRRVEKAKRERRVAEVADVLGLSELLERRPGALSGGQRQRVAMGRAIVREPAAFLMDEPLSNLDAKLRVSMRSQLTRLHERLGITTVYVTHDQVEAMTLGSRVAVLRDGVLQQCDTPQELFHRPANLFVAAFIGSPAMNLVEAEIAGDEVTFDGYRIALPPGSPLRGLDRRVILGVRPTDFEGVGPATDPALPRLRVKVDVVEQLGSESHLIFAVDAPRFSADAVLAAQESDDADDGMLLADERSQFTARVDGRFRVRAGDEVTLALDAAALHAFDTETGLALGERAPAPRAMVVA